MLIIEYTDVNGLVGIFEYNFTGRVRPRKYDKLCILSCISILKNFAFPQELWLVLKPGICAS